MTGTSNTSSNLMASATGYGFWWDGAWHQVKPSHGDDDGPPAGVREPRRPRPTSPAGAVAIEPELASA